MKNKNWKNYEEGTIASKDGQKKLRRMNIALREQENNLLESLKDWRKPQDNLETSPDIIELVAGLPIQQYYTEVPFRDEEKGDFVSTVASSGCAILIAKFIERYFALEKDMLVSELARMAWNMVTEVIRRKLMVLGERWVWCTSGLTSSFQDFTT